jgi:hypothetical protein
MTHPLASHSRRRGGVRLCLVALIMTGWYMVSGLPPVRAQVAVEPPGTAPGDLEPVTPLFATSSGDAQSARASSDYVVWSDQRGVEVGSVYGYDIQRQEVFRLNAEECSAAQPSVAGHLAVWVGVCPKRSTSFVEPDAVVRSQVIGYDLERRESFVIDETASTWGTLHQADGVNAVPETDGDYVVWLAGYRCYRGCSGTPMAHHLATGETWPLAMSRDDHNAFHIHISGGLTWWSRFGIEPGEVLGSALAAGAVYDLERRQVVVERRALGDSVRFLFPGPEGTIIVRQEESLFSFDPCAYELTYLGAAPRQGVVQAYAPELGLVFTTRRADGVPSYAGTEMSTSVLCAVDLVSGAEAVLTVIEDYSVVGASVFGSVLTWQGISSYLTPPGAGSKANIYVARLHDRSAKWIAS